MKSYETLIVRHIEHCDENTLSQLWKGCFYKQIEDYRQTLKQIKAAADDFEAKSHVRANSEAPKFKQLMAYAQESFDRFLQKGTKFFQSLVRKVRPHLSCCLVGFITNRVVATVGDYRCCDGSYRHRENGGADEVCVQVLSLHW